MSEKPFSQLVVVGSSAGGIEALSQLVSALPEDFPAPIVLAQHLDPERESNLGEILSRRSALPVRTVVDEQPLEAGVVFVVPANRHVRITDSEIGLQVDSVGRPKPSVDLLMSTAAEVFGENLIAVVLTGMGSDGTDGARVVSEAGGTVVVQNPQTADFGGMPGSLAPNTVDIAANLGEIGRILGDLLAQFEAPEEEPQEEEEKRSLRRFLENLREGYGVDFGNYKAPTIIRRLKRRLVATGQADVEAYGRYLEENPEEYRHLLNSFLIKVTDFFRDPEHFDYLKEEVLPGLVEEARQENRQLRIWSAGCATGEEAYSLAIALSEVLGSEMGFYNVRIFATDLDEDAIDFARRGLYPASSLRGLSEERVECYFFEEDGQYRIKKSIRSMVVFGEHDLSRRSPFPDIDLCVSRNVLIYFTDELQKRALQLFAYSLRDGGYLVLGKAESVSSLSDLFAQVNRQYRVYRRQGGRFPMPPLPAPPPSPSPRRTPKPDEVMAIDLQAPLGPRSAADVQRRVRGAGDEYLGRLPVGVVVVDRGYDIQTINAAARRLLSIHGVAVGEDFLHAMQEGPYAEVRAMIDAAFGADSTSGEFAFRDLSAGDNRYLRLDCYAQRAEESTEGPVETVMVVVNDVTYDAQTRRRLEERIEALHEEIEASRREAEAETADLRAQNERLIEANRRLQGANEELTDLNEQLQTAYEESLISAEEAQAATEELETLNEEFQATNEELETLNEELQATIEELNTTNEDLQARSAELQEMARSREAERKESEAARRRLKAVLQGVGDALLAVTTEGEVLFSNEIFRETFGGGEPGEDNTGPHLGRLMILDENGERMPREATPQVRAAREESFEMRFIVEGKDGMRRSFEARGRPLNGSDARGSVVVIRQIPEG